MDNAGINTIKYPVVMDVEPGKWLKRPINNIETFVPLPQIVIWRR